MAGDEAGEGEFARPVERRPVTPGLSSSLLRLASAWSWARGLRTRSIVSSVLP
jgi:hypothetical protein